MEWIGGSEEARELIIELQKSGDLIDVYSEEGLANNGIEEYFSLNLNQLVKEHGDKFIHHLLIGCFHDSYLSSLVELYEPTEEYLNNPYEAKSIVAILNLNIKAILLIGISSRKKHYVEKYYFLNPKHKEKDFLKLDHIGVINKFRSSVSKMADGMNTQNYIPGSDDLYNAVIGKNGNWYLESESDNAGSDDEDLGMAEETLNNLKSEFEDAEEEIVEGRYFLSNFFPKFDTVYVYE